LLFTSTLSRTAAAADSTLETPTGAYRKISFTAGGELKSIGQVEKAPAMSATFHLQFRNNQPVYCFAEQRGPIGMYTIVDFDASGVKLTDAKLSGTIRGKFFQGRWGDTVMVLDADVSDGRIQGTYDWKLHYPSKYTPRLNEFSGTIAAVVIDAAEIRRSDGLASTKAWGSWTGPQADFSANHGRALVDSLSDARLVWLSESEVLAGRGGEKEGGGHPYGGYSSPIVADGKVYLNQWAPSGDAVAEKSQKTTDRRINADDVVLCFDAATGQLLWKRVFPGAGLNQASSNKHVYHNNTGCWHDGRVYMVGFTWRVYCLDGDTGELIWQSHVGDAHLELEKAKAEAIANRQMLTPTDVNKYLDVADGIPFTYNLKGGIVAFDPATGKRLWTVPVSSTHVHRATINGAERIIAQQREGIVAIEPRTGDILWTGAVRGNMIRIGVSGTHLLTSTGSAKTKDYRLHGYRIGSDCLSERWTDLDAGAMVGWNCIAGNDLYFQSVDASGQGHVVRLDLDKGSVAARAAYRATWSTAAFVVEDRLMVNGDIAHADSALSMFDARTLKPMGPERWYQPHLETSAYDAPIAVPYVDGRLFFRGMKRLACYDIRGKP